jgi:hypothetical protein
MVSQKLAVIAAYDISDPRLQLHVRPGRGAYCALFGWEAEPWPADDGPPELVEQVFATALVTCGTLAFLDVPAQRTSKTAWPSAHGDSWLPIKAALWDRVTCRKPPWVVATDAPARARTVFNGDVNWCRQSQVGFLLQRGRFPRLDRDLILKLLTRRYLELDAIDLPDGVVALVLPAVDGDYMEIVTLDAVQRDLIRDAVANECSHRGIPFSVRDSVLSGTW